MYITSKLIHVRPLIEFYNPHSFSKLPRNYGDYKIHLLSLSFFAHMGPDGHIVYTPFASDINRVQRLIEFYNPHSFSAVLKNYGDYKNLGKKLRSVPKR